MLGIRVYLLAGDFLSLRIMKERHHKCHRQMMKKNKGRYDALSQPRYHLLS